MSAMAGMSRAIRQEFERHAPTLQLLRDDVLHEYAEIVTAFSLDLRGELERRKSATSEVEEETG